MHRQNPIWCDPWIWAPRSFILNMTLGRTYLILEEYGNAYQKISECEAYAEGDQDWAQIYFWRAQALENLDGQAAVARKNWSNLLKLPEDTYPEEWKDIAEERLGQVATSSHRTATTDPYRYANPYPHANPNPHTKTVMRPFPNHAPA